MYVSRRIRPCLHRHGGSLIETDAEVRPTIDAIGTSMIGLCLDSLHALLGGSDPLDLIREDGQIIRQVHIKVRIPLNPITHSGVFDHPRSEAAERPTRGLVQPLMVTSSRWSADSLARRRWWATVGIREGHPCLPGADAAVLGRLWRADPA